MEKYQVPLSDWSASKIENLKVVLNQGEMYLKSLSEVSQRITNRAYSIITILITLTTGLVVYVVKSSTDIEEVNTPLFYFSFGIIVTLVVMIMLVSRLLMPRLFMPIGRSPREIVNDDLMGVTLEGELSLKALLLNEIENCQQKIDFNEKQNASRNRSISNLMKFIVYFLVFFVIGGFIGVMCLLEVYQPQ